MSDDGNDVFNSADGAAAEVVNTQPGRHVEEACEVNPARPTPEQRLREQSNHVTGHPTQCLVKRPQPMKEDNNQTQPSVYEWLELHRLILKHDMESVKKWFQDRNLSSDAIALWSLNSHWPLQSAACSGDVDVFNALLQYGFDPHERYFLGPSLMMSAAESGSTDMVDLLITLKVAPSAQDHQFEGDTLLHSAAHNSGDNSSMIRYLIRRGIDPNERNTSWETPLHIAAGTGSSHNIRALLEGGASVNTRSIAGSSPLRCLITSNKKENILEQASILCDAGATCDLENHSLCEFYLATHTHNLSFIALLLKKNFCISSDGYETLPSTPLRNIANMTDSDARQRAVAMVMAAGYDIRFDFRWITDPLLYPPLDTGLDNLKRQLMFYATNPRTLLHLSSFTIRKLLGHSLSSSLDKLPIPDVLKDVVSLKDVLDLPRTR